MMSMAKNQFSAAFARRTTPPAPKMPGPVLAIQALAYLVVALAVFYPAALADVTDTVIAKYGLMAGLRWGISMLGLYVLVNRRLTTWEPFAVLLAIFGLLGNYAQAMGSPVPITLSDTCVRLALATFIIRLLFRPTPAEDRSALRAAQAHNEQLRSQLAQYEAAKEPHE